MKQFLTILCFELKHYFKNKIFIGSTVFLAAAIAVVMFFPKISSVLKTEDETPINRQVAIVAGEGADFAAPILGELFPEHDVMPFDGDFKAEVSEGRAEFAVEIKEDLSYTYYVENLSLQDFNRELIDSAIQTVYRMTAMTSGGISAEEAGEILSFTPKGEAVSLGRNQAENYLYTYIMIIALYMVIMLYGQMVATSVASEKSSRAMEMLITAADTTSMMFGKVIAACTAGLVQLGAVFGSAVLFYNINRTSWEGNFLIESLFDIPPSLLGYMLLFFFMGFFIYAFLYGGVGSTASKLEDVNTAVMPLTFMFIAAYFVVVYSMSAGDFDNMLLKVCSYIPFTSPMAMFTRVAMTEVAPIEIAISTALLSLSVVAIGVLSAKIYKIGVLLYGTPPKPATIIRALRQK